MATNGNGLWLVVTGPGRCGTKFTNRVLQSVGLTTGHQFIFRPGRGGPGSPEVLPELKELVTVGDLRHRVKAYKASEWGPQAETSWLAVPYLDLPEMDDITTVHLVREPRKVINSLVKCQVFEARNRYGLYYDFAHHWVPEMRDLDTAIQRAGMFYLRWNEMAEGRCDHFWNVEKDVTGLLDALGIDYAGRDIFDDTSYNQRGGPFVDCGLDDFPEPLRGELENMAYCYGYQWPDR